MESPMTRAGAGMTHRPTRSPLALRCWCAALLVQAGLRAPGADVPTSIELQAHTAPGMRTTKDQPMSVLWIEDVDGRFVRTLWCFSRDKKYFKDLTVWHALSSPAELAQDVDAVTGATIIQGDTGRLRIPRKWKGLDLLSGRYVLRVETAKDHAKHYSSMRIPLGPKALGRSYADPGYVRSIDLAASPADASATEVVMALPSIAPESPVQSAPAPTDTRSPPTKDTP